MLRDDLRRESGLDRKDLTNDMAVNVGQTIVAAGMAISESLVVEAHQVQDRRVQVVNVDLVLDGVPAESSVAPCTMPAADAAAGHPHRESERMVLAAVGSLGRRSAAEFSAPDDERVVEQARELSDPCSSAAIGRSTAAQRLGRFSRRPL